MVAVSSMVKSGSVVSGPNPGVFPAIVLYGIIADRRFPESVSFASEARRLGHDVSMIDGDITSLWYSEIGPRWEQGHAAVGGLTTQGPLFCLERWAWDKGMRVILKMQHLRQADGQVRHLLAPEATSVLNQKLAAAGEAYPVVAARAVHACAQGAPLRGLSPEVTCRLADPEALYSWIIAPRIVA